MRLKCKDKPETDARLFGEMLKAARDGLYDLCGAKVGDKTFVDTVIPAQEAYQAAVDNAVSLREALKQMSDAAEKGKDSTRWTSLRKSAAPPGWGNARGEFSTPVQRRRR